MMSIKRLETKKITAFDFEMTSSGSGFSLQVKQTNNYKAKRRRGGKPALVEASAVKYPVLF